MPGIRDVTTAIEPAFVEVVDAVGGAQKDNGNRVGKCGRKRKEDGALPSNKLKQPTRGAGSFLGYQALVKIVVDVATTVVEGTGLVNLDLDSQTFSSSFHYAPWALHSDLAH